jgi:calcineurin-like phosphoesterase family protein
MDDAIADRVNACVKATDVLYFLGDFCMEKAEQVAAYRKRLVCRTIHFTESRQNSAKAPASFRIVGDALRDQRR